MLWNAWDNMGICRKANTASTIQCTGKISSQFKNTCSAGRAKCLTGSDNDASAETLLGSLQGSDLILALYNTDSPTPAPYLPSLGSPMPARGKEVLLLDSKPFNNWLPDEGISGIEKDVTLHWIST